MSVQKHFKGLRKKLLRQSFEYVTKYISKLDEALAKELASYHSENTKFSNKEY